MSALINDAPIVKVVMLKGKDGAKSKLSELTNDMTFLTEEEIITLVTNIVESGSVGDIDTGFVTKIVEQNRHRALKFWVGTQAEYDAIDTIFANTFYIITDDTFKEDVLSAITNLQNQINNIVVNDYENEISALQETNQIQDIKISTLTTSLAALRTEYDSMYEYLFYPISNSNVNEVSCTVDGYITNSKTEIALTIPLRKAIPESADVQVTYAAVTARQKGSYVLGSSSYPTVLQASEVTATNNHFFSNVRLNVSAYSTSMANAENNSTVGVSLLIRFKIV